MFKLTIDYSDNQAIIDDCDYEITNILRRVAGYIDQGFTYGSANDTNGNKIGEWSYDKKGNEKYINGGTN